jgi:predicted nucleic acid-binding protein
VNVYVDSSVLLRMALNERGALREWRRIDRPLASELIRLECRRTIDRARIRERLSDDAVADQREVVLGLLDAFDIVPLDGVVLERAAEPFPTLLGSLDAIHLATAVLARAQVEDLYFATHDGELATAARAVGFTVLGGSAPRRRKRRGR